jgi:hypothetical protein
MLNYLYLNSNNKTSLTKITEQKIINDSYTNKFYIRSSIVETQDILILDNNYKFLLLNKNNIEKYLAFFKNNNILGKSIQLKEFIYSRKNYFKIKFYIGNIVYNNYLSYLKLLYILKQTIKININLVWPLLVVNRGNFSYVFNGLRGFLPRKSFGKLRKILKKLKMFLSMKQKFLILLKKYKKLILKSLLLKNLKANKLFVIKHKYKNQLKNKNSFLKISPFIKNKKPFLKTKK